MNSPHASNTGAGSYPASGNDMGGATGRRKPLRAALLIMVVLASGCATSQQPANNDERVAAAPLLTRPDGSVRVDSQNQESARLWASAERAQSEGRTQIALELLYEALEIEPQNSLLWSRAAELQLDILEPELAENYALRSNSRAGENRPLLYRNWLIIEHARSMRGDLLGVRSAHKQVQVYQIK